MGIMYFKRNNHSLYRVIVLYLVTFEWAVIIQSHVYYISIKCLSRDDQVSYCVALLTDSRCIHGGQHGTAVYQVLAGGTEEQQAGAGRPADQTAGDEPHDCATGMHTLYNATFIPFYVLLPMACAKLIKVCLKCKIVLEFYD